MGSDSDCDSNIELATEDLSKIDLEKLNKHLEVVLNLIPTVQKDIEEIVEYQAKDILLRLKSELDTEFDTTFLSDYIKVVDSNDAVAIRDVTNDILSCIQRALKPRTSTETSFVQTEGVILAAWLTAASLWSAPRAPGAGRALHALLAVLPPAEVKRVALAWWRVAADDPDALVELSDATRAPPTPPALSDTLLRAALYALEAAAAGEASRLEGGAPTAAEVCEVAPRARSLNALLRVAARALAAEHDTTNRKVLVASLERAVRDGAGDTVCERMRVGTSVKNLRTLFVGYDTESADGVQKRKLDRPDRAGKRLRSVDDVAVASPDRLGEQS